jgi:hypothetical protein
VNNAAGIHAVVSAETRNAWTDGFVGAIDVPYGADPVEFYAFMFSRDYYNLAGKLNYDNSNPGPRITPAYLGIWADYEKKLEGALANNVHR